MANEIRIVTRISRSETGKLDIDISRLGSGDDPIEMAADAFEKVQQKCLVDLVGRYGGWHRKKKGKQ